jgi:RimJ/RimL family protein N-acetyltransferase
MMTREQPALAEGSALRLGIGLVSEQRIIGTLALFNLSPANRRGEIGYALARDCWARGYMQEALTGFIAWLFDTLGLHRLEADVDPANLASARSLRRMGFQRDGLLRESWLVDGEVSDSELHGLLAREWRRAGTA